MGRSTFNDYLMQVDRAWAQSKESTTPLDWHACRGSVFYAVAHKMRPDLAKRMSGTENDPRKVKYEDLDGWLGWFVAEWNRSLHRQLWAEGDRDGER